MDLDTGEGAGFIQAENNIHYLRHDRAGLRRFRCIALEHPCERIFQASNLAFYFAEAAQYVLKLDDL